MGGLVLVSAISLDGGRQAAASEVAESSASLRPAAQPVVYHTTYTYTGLLARSRAMAGRGPGSILTQLPRVATHLCTLAEGLSCTLWFVSAL